jgi:hypothetical protein
MSKSTSMLDNQAIDSVLEAVYGWSRRQAYKGYNKHDGLNSPILHGLLGWGRWPRMLATQGVMRFPVNIRPLLLTKKTYNPKGLALFAQGQLDRFRASGEQACLEQARGLLDLLLELRSPGDWHGYAWGYQYPWQDPGFFVPAATPNAVVTAFVCEAFLDAWRCTGERDYLEVVGRALPFFLQDLTILKDTPEEICLGYMPVPMRMRVMDVSILIGAVMAQYAAVTGDAASAATARRLVAYVVGQQTDEHAWFYTDPPGDSHITHDNYHTGFILDALWRYMQSTGDETWMSTYEKGLEFYATRHFNTKGAPRWMHDKEYPHDIHGAAQGILTFSRHRHDYPGLADKIAEWAFKTMYHPEGRFYYQERRFYKIRFTLLRWCNAWMCRALASYALNMKGSVR